MINHIGGIASLVTSLTVVGSALIWIYNTFISKPREQRREKENEKRQERMIQLITQENKPLNDAIHRLSDILDDSVKDRENLNRIAKENTKKINDNKSIIDKHDDRLIILETKNGIYYKEG